MTEPAPDSITRLRKRWQKLVSEERLKLIDEKHQFEVDKERTLAALRQQTDALSQQKRELEILLAEYDGKLRKPRSSEERTKLDQERVRLKEERRQLEEERREFESLRTSTHWGPKDERYHGRVLGLQGKVTFDEIKHAYRRLASQCHPDRVQQMHPDIVAFTNAKMSEVNAAWEFFQSRYG